MTNRLGQMRLVTNRQSHISQVTYVPIGGRCLKKGVICLVQTNMNRHKKDTRLRNRNKMYVVIRRGLLEEEVNYTGMDN